MNQIDLSGKRAVVTGAAQGIGLAITQRLLASGAQVCLWDRDGESLEEALRGLSAVAVSSEVVDVSDADAVENAGRRTELNLGGVDILINNAGVAGPTMPLWNYPINAWKDVMDVDLNSVFYCCRAFIPMMIEQNYGRVVNVSSVAGKEGNPNAAAYSAAKAGVIALTKSLAKETVKYNIAVNCVSPAAARTRIFDQMSQEHVDYMLSKIPRGRFVLLKEIAAMVAWMVSEENSFTTGSVFDLSGGRATY